MSQNIKYIYLESYDFNKKSFMSIEHQWKAIFRVIPLSRELPDLLFVAVSNNFNHTDGLQVGITQEVLDIKEVVSLIESQLDTYLKNGDDRRLLDKLFIIDK